MREVKRSNWELRRAYQRAKYLRAMDRHQTGDFDDMGREQVANQYHYQQARRRGCLFN